MNLIQKRFLLFIFGCITTRFLFVYIAKNISKKYLPYLGALAVIPATGFLIIYFGGYRKTGVEKHLIKRYGGIICVPFMRYFT